MRHRRAYTIVEMMVVVTLLGTFSVLVVMSLATVVGIDNSARRELATSQALGMCELQLRDDIHRASDVWIDDGTLRLRPDATHTLLWQARQGELIRELWEADTLLKQDRWSLPAKYQAHWSREQDWVKLAIARPASNATTDSGDNTRSMEIAVEVNRFVKMHAVEATP